MDIKLPVIFRDKLAEQKNAHGISAPIKRV
jgi:hypothetical protein